jgi:hypothetical protein
MAISFVNGFLCTCSCDVTKAKQGQDPHPAAHLAKVAAERREKVREAVRTARPAQPAVTFGGSLSGLGQPAAAVQAAPAAGSSADAIVATGGASDAEAAALFPSGTSPSGTLASGAILNVLA